MPVDTLRHGGVVVDALRSALRYGGSSLADVPTLLKQIIAEDLWRERVVQQTGEIARFERFVDFVQTPPLEGLGADLRMLQRMCGDDDKALDLIDQATVGERGAPEGNQNAARPKTNSDNVTICLARDDPERGNGRQYALRRLRKERPDLHEQVITGKVSPNAAMIEAGFRERTITIPLNVEKMARAIQHHFDAEQRRELVALLSEEA